MTQLQTLSSELLEQIEDKVRSGERISLADAKNLYQYSDLNQISALSQLVKERYHDQVEVTYLIMAIINYTNVCVARCDYCSFYRLPHEPDTYLLDFDAICSRIDRFLEFDGHMVSFNGGFHPGLTLDHYAQLFSRIRERYGKRLEFYEMTVAEFMFSCKLGKIPYAEGAKRLKDAGVTFVSGGGAEILEDNFRRRHSPGKYKAADYFLAQQAILDAGLGSTATMVIGFDESLDERLAHLDALRSFQDRNDGALVSFLCWTYKPYNNRLGGEEVSSEDYWRWLAICRIFLDNFVNIRTSVLTRNADGLRALNFGANDFDLPTEDEVTQKAGATISHDFATLLHEAEVLGFRPTLRAPYPPRLPTTSHQETWKPLPEAHDSSKSPILSGL